MERIGGDVRRELGRFGPAAGMAEVVETWENAVGPGIAANAWPARLARDGTLHVATSSSAWAFELGQLEPTLRERLATAVGDAAPTKLRFAVGRLPERDEPASEPVSSRPPEPSAQHRAAAAELAAVLTDDTLRDLVARAAAASLARGVGNRAVW
jgi:hypothetical protein